MKTPYPMLRGFLLTLVCSTAFAEQQALVTVDPNNFAPGQNISNAIAGARLLAMTIIPNPDPNLPGTLIPQYSPAVYAQPVAASCYVFVPGVPCALNGNLALGYTATTIPATQPILWGEENVASRCFLVVPPICDGGSEGPVLRVNFNVPTDYATAMVGYWAEDGAAIESFEAFDGGGQSLGKCIGRPPFSLPAGCSTTVLSDPNNAAGWVQLTIARPTADISFVLIGGEGNIRPIAQVQFNSPVSVQLAGLLSRVQGVGPGKSLTYKIIFALTFYEVHDIQATCAMLTGFGNEVAAQSGKHINNRTAAQLLATTQAIEAALHCHY
ncbi:MAG TPA: hypothetical protein VK803_07890 [Steroidobacteraceae bacterium]|nr:hypothetical protein [Steroidobacteraceae bacterium]